MKDPAVHNELRAAAYAFARAQSRARQIGLTNAPTDAKVAKQLDATTRHLAKALEQARHRNRRHLLRRIVVLLIVLTGGALAAWKLTSTRQLLDLNEPSD
jgi:hypothetical protein